jgi:hypothetical protein
MRLKVTPILKLEDTVIPTSERPVQLGIWIIENIDQRLETRIETPDHQEQRHKDDRVVDNCQFDITKETSQKTVPMPIQSAQVKVLWTLT